MRQQDDSVNLEIQTNHGGLEIVPSGFRERMLPPKLPMLIDPILIPSAWAHASDGIGHVSLEAGVTPTPLFSTPKTRV